MPKIIISGCNGHMGNVVSKLCAADPEITVVAGFDVNSEENGDFPVYSDPMEYDGASDAIIDFSNPSALDGLLSYMCAKKIPGVLCTTGYAEQQLAQIKKASEIIPVFKSANMSLGINLLAVLLKKATEVLYENFDIEIVEKHHNRKLDAPSGTAVMLADAINDALPYDAQYVYERQSVRKARDKKEIGISSVRGGTIVGEHEVIFAGNDEVIELKHTAYSREVFAAGAVKAAKYIARISVPGIYDMNSMLSDLL